MGDVGPNWLLPKHDYIKINVHGVFSEEPWANGNRSGIGIVFRNDKGTIVRMYASTLGLLDRRLNELNAMHFSLRKAFFEGFPLIELESDHAGAYWEWRHAHFDGVIPEHQHVLRQINTRIADDNSIIEIDMINEESNQLAIYLAQHGANTWDRMVEIEAPFGRVREIWYDDMGLGSIAPEFDTVRKTDLVAEIDNEAMGILEDVEMV